MTRYLLLPSGKTKPALHIFFVVILAAIFAATWFIGVVPTRVHPYDTVFFADAGWRTLAGLRPHLDYYSPYGSGVQLLLAAGQWLAGGTIDGVGYMGACVGLIVGAWAYLLLLRRASPAIAVAGGALLALLCVAPVSLGYTYAFSSQAMFYNRFAFALLGLLIIEAFPVLPSSPNSAVGAFSTGVICALLLFLKASYFAVAVALAAASLLWKQPLQLRRLLTIACGFLAGAFPFLIYLQFRVDLLYADLQMAAVSRTAPLAPIAIVSLFTQDLIQLFILSALGFLLGYEYAAQGLPRWRFVILAFVIYGSGILLMSTNAQPARLPLDEMLALLFAGAFLEIALRPSARLQPAIATALAIVALGITLPNAGTDAAALANGMRLKRFYNPAYAHIVPIPVMAPFVMLDDYTTASETSINTGTFLVPYLTDGVELLRRHLQPGELVTTMDSYNPFPFLLQISPPQGGMAAAVGGFLFDEKHHPTENGYFGNADVVMYPKHSALNEDMFSKLPKIYGPELAHRFTLAAESSWWKLYRRNLSP